MLDVGDVVATPGNDGLSIGAALLEVCQKTHELCKDMAIRQYKTNITNLSGPYRVEKDNYSFDGTSFSTMKYAVSGKAGINTFRNR